MDALNIQHILEEGNDRHQVSVTTRGRRLTDDLTCTRGCSEASRGEQHPYIPQQGPGKPQRGAAEGAPTR